MKKIVLLIALFIPLIANSAAVEMNGVITNIVADGGVIKVGVCSSQESTNCKSFWIRPDTDYNKTIIAMMLTAKTASNPIWIQGVDGQPSDWPYKSAYAFAAINIRN